MLKKKKEMRAVDDALEFMKEEFRKRMTACDEREARFKEKQAEMKTMVGVHHVATGLASPLWTLLCHCPNRLSACACVRPRVLSPSRAPGSSLPAVHTRERREAHPRRNQNPGTCLPQHDVPTSHTHVHSPTVLPPVPACPLPVDFCPSFS